MNFGKQRGTARLALSCRHQNNGLKWACSTGDRPAGRTISAAWLSLLGRPAYPSPGRTIGILFDDGKASTGPGGIARTLLIAKDPKDGGLSSGGTGAARQQGPRHLPEGG